MSGQISVRRTNRHITSEFSAAPEKPASFSQLNTISRVATARIVSGRRPIDSIGFSGTGDLTMPDGVRPPKGDLMAKRNLTGAACILTALVTLGSTGCVSYGPNLGPFAYPIPISPYFQDREEDQFWNHERYDRVPILAPLTPDGPRVAMDTPSDDEVMRTLEKARPVEGGFPLLHERQRTGVRIAKEKIADYVDEPRVYPMIGPAQLHHAHYKCTVYFTEATRVGWPIPYTTKDEDAVEVLYIDHNHLHMVGNVDPGAGSNY